MQLDSCWICQRRLSTYICNIYRFIYSYSTNVHEYNGWFVTFIYVMVMVIYSSCEWHFWAIQILPWVVRSYPPGTPWRTDCVIFLSNFMVMVIYSSCMYGIQYWRFKWSEMDLNLLNWIGLEQIRINLIRPALFFCQIMGLVSLLNAGIKFMHLLVRSLILHSSNFN
jgi:hypothetical protein